MNGRTEQGVGVALIGPDDALCSTGRAPFESRRPEERAALGRALTECRSSGRVQVLGPHLLVPVPSSGDILWIERADASPPAASDTRAEILLAHSREVLTLLDRSFRVVYRTPSSERPLGYRDGLVGRSALEILHPDDRPGVVADFGKVLERPGASARTVVRALHADGSWRILDAVATNLLEVPEIGAVLLAYRDVTEERLAEDQVLAASRLASIGTLAASVGHEINNPLTYMLGNLDRVLEILLAPGAADDPRAVLSSIFELVAEARDGARRIGEIVSDLELLANPDSEQLTAVNVDAAVERALTIASSQILVRGQIEKNLGSPPPALAVEGGLVQAVINLLLNAAQALPPERTGGRIEIATWQSGDEVIVAVTDDGSGIPEAVRRQIFEPHFTTKRGAGGSGLGLWVVQRIVEAFGGRVQVESELGRGSTFRLILRAAPQAPAKLAIARIKTPVTAQASVLVVDDERAVASSLARVLERVHEVSIATSGQEVLERMDRGERWDVVVSDVVMPGMNGLELRERVAKRSPSLGRAFVFVSGGGFDRDVKDALESLGLDYLSKPPNLTELRAAVARLVSKPPK